METLSVIIGVIVGYLLKLIPTGKLKVIINEFRKIPYQKNSAGQEVKAKDDLNNICRIDFYYDIDLYNSASNFRIIRNLKMISKYINIENEYTLEDLSTEVYTKKDYGQLLTIDPLSCVNIPPKLVKNLRLQLIVNERDEEMDEKKINELFNAKIHLQYFNFRGRKKKINI